MSSNMIKIKFYCPKCGQRIRPDNNFRFECKHKGTEHEKGILSDPDKYLIDEVFIDIKGVTLAFKAITDLIT